MEMKKSIHLPEAYLGLLEDIRLLKSDDCNPNKMNNKQKERVWQSLRKHGWIYPIVTDLNGVFSDGEQRVQVCKDHTEFFAPVLRLTLTDSQRRLLRQTLNKLHGKHSKQLDEADYRRIIEAGEKDDLQALLSAVGEKLPEDLGGKRDGSGRIPESYELVINCKDETDQKVKFEKLKSEGYQIRVLNL